MRALTDETGTTIDTRGYEAFGTKNVEAGSDPLTYGFAGEPFQQDSMLAYHRARWMDARVGRFLGMDAKDGHDRSPTSWHKYTYAFNSPTNLADSSGYDPGLFDTLVGIISDVAYTFFKNSYGGTIMPQPIGGPLTPTEKSILYPFLVNQQQFTMNDLNDVYLHTSGSLPDDAPFQPGWVWAYSSGVTPDPGYPYDIYIAAPGISGSPDPQHPVTPGRDTIFRIGNHRA